MAEQSSKATTTAKLGTGARILQGIVLTGLVVMTGAAAYQTWKQVTLPDFRIGASGGPVNLADVPVLQWNLLRELDLKSGVAAAGLKQHDGKQVRIPGFVVPLEDNKSMVSEFLLVPYVGACIHTPPPPAQPDRAGENRRPEARRCECHGSSLGSWRVANRHGTQPVRGCFLPDACDRSRTLSGKTMKSKFGLTFLLLTTSVFSQTKAPAAKKAPVAATRQPAAQHAHDHGAAKINIGVEGNEATVEFESAADPVVGFEHKPKTAADQKKVDAALAALKSRFGEVVIVPAALGCKFTNVKAEYEMDGTHAEVHAEFKLQCAKPLKGAEIRFGVTRMYPEIEEVQVQAISDTGQTGGTIKRDKGSVKIG